MNVNPVGPPALLLQQQSSAPGPSREEMLAVAAARPAALALQGTALAATERSSGTTGAGVPAVSEGGQVDLYA